MKHVVIIGNGIAGITAARHIRKGSDFRITVISGESDHFYSRTALMYLYMGQMEYKNLKPYEDWFWPKNRIELVTDWVEKVDVAQKQLVLRQGEPLSYDELIIAAGSRWRKGGWPGEGAKGVHGLYSLQDLEAIEASTAGIERGVIVGGGLIGVELAEMLHSRGIPVSLLVREKGYWASVLPPEEARLVGDHLRQHHIELRFSTSLKEVEQDAAGRVQAVVTSAEERISCQFLGITIGVEPNIDFLKGSGIETDRGVLVDEYFRTSVSGVYAIGDCAQYRKPPIGRKAVEQVWYTGREHGLLVAQTICGKPAAYKPGPWFNSAKFFEVEYQVYGDVPSRLPEGWEWFYWQHPQKHQALRLVWEKESGKFRGVNLLGIRYRQEVCEQWIISGTKIEEVVGQLHRANFDPEFHSRHEGEIRNAFSTQTGRTIKEQKKKWWVFGA
ncbi:NAD(P)/FAD-dependent oxidoreductase [Cesiribacter sp. SM1]|uniref:NAD(P)/FAD-dependent oxidoreductase n=1 Tax=Cesiribacter sp. SM1 TaxID=2861196 RepID=UPI001CD3318A|nr:FAD/NAD(P)-binding oxidoreductase [Cesiribacter sp. SM1]